MMEARCSSETSVLTRVTRGHIAEHAILQETIIFQLWTWCRYARMKRRALQKPCVVGVATGYELTTVWSQSKSRKRQELSLIHRLQTGSGTYSAFHPAGTGDFFPRCKAVGAWNWPLTSNQWTGQENMNLYICSPHAFMTYCLVKHWDSCIFPLHAA
jgi:hypothetical protein